MKIFEDINILIRVKLFRLKNLFFLEEAFIWKKSFENKNNVFEKTKNLFAWKKLLFKRKKNFFF